MSDKIKKLLEVNSLKTEFKTQDGSVTAVNGVTFEVRDGEILGLVGESGCGKSVTSLSIMRLLKDTGGGITGGEVLFNGEDLVKMPEPVMRTIRGREISMIFQEPMTSLNPVIKIGDQMIETIRKHTNKSKSEAMAIAKDMLVKVGIPRVDEVVKEYPHQLSGGMNQRVMIAMAMSLEPTLLIADEPTTALDVTIQAQILELMKKLNKESNMSIILITHDLGVVAEMCTRVVVMYAGRIVEEANVLDLFKEPLHPYTTGLIASVPVLGRRVERLDSIPGNVPTLAKMPKGCKFAPRCAHRMERCDNEEPPVFHIDAGYTRKCRCWLMENDDRAIKEDQYV